MLVLSSQTKNGLLPPNLKLNLTSEQCQLILESWRLIKQGKFREFKEQKLIADPVCLWRLIFLDTILRIDPQLRATDHSNLDYKNLGYQIIERVHIALNILLNVFQEYWEQEGKDIASQLMLLLVNYSEQEFYQQADLNYSNSIIEQALSQTFERVLGEQFDEQTAVAWLTLWSLITRSLTELKSDEFLIL